MSTSIQRKGNCLFSFSDEARRRAKEYLLSSGVPAKALEPIVWPQDAVSAYRKHFSLPWEFTTKADVQRGKRERMEHSLRFKREYGVIQKRPLYVWVFWCPGISFTFFRGWWIDIVGRGIDFNCKFFDGTTMCSSLLDLFPLVENNLFGPRDIEKWKAEFVKRYQRGLWCGKPQGKAPIWAEVQGTDIRKILGRAKWPKGENYGKERFNAKAG